MKSMLKRFGKKLFIALGIVVTLIPLALAEGEGVAFTQELADSISGGKVAADTVWTLVTAMLVFWMNAGFGMLEAGLQQAKNCVNVSAKNFVVFAISSLAFWMVGWGLMSGEESGFRGIKGLGMISGADTSPATGAAYQGVYASINWTTVPL